MSWEQGVKLAPYIILFGGLLASIGGFILTKGQAAMQSKFRRVVEDSILNKSLDRGQVEELVVSKYKQVFSSSDTDAKRWAHDFIGTLPKRRQEALTLRGL